MEPGHGSEDSNDLRMHPAMTVDEGNHFTNGKKLSSSSSSSSSSSGAGDPFEFDAKETQLASKERENAVPVNTIPWQEQDPSNIHTLSSNSVASTQFPPTQVMERPADPNHTASYRIPSSVFARTKSTAPMEWSCTSNESLFSIHTGNMSFTRDHVFWLNKSGELGLPGDSTLSGPLIDFSSNQPPSTQISMNKSTELGQKNGNVDDHFRVTESKAAETMREVIKENEEERNKEKGLAKETIYSPSLGRRSDVSGASIKSFAFPILTGDDKSYSVSHKRHPSSRLQSQPATPKVARHRLPEPQIPKPETATLGGTPTVANGKWFSCFSCCQFCS